MTQLARHLLGPGAVQAHSGHDPAFGHGEQINHLPPRHRHGSRHSSHGGHDSGGAHGGHDKHAGHDPDVFRRRFWLTLLISIPVVATSEMIMDWLGYHLSG